MVDTENLSYKDLITADSGKMEELVSENQTLRGQIQALQQQEDSRREVAESVDGRASAQVDILEREKQVLISENEHLKKLAQSASQVEKEYYACTVLL